MEFSWERGGRDNQDLPDTVTMDFHDATHPWGFIPGGLLFVALVLLTAHPVRAGGTLASTRR